MRKKFDGSQVMQFDSISPYSYSGDNWKRFFKTGNTITNSIALTGGSETQNFRFSAHLKIMALYPIPVLRGSIFRWQLIQKWVGNSALYQGAILQRKHKNIGNVSDSPDNIVIPLYYLPGDMNVMNLLGDPNKPGSVPSLQCSQIKVLPLVIKRHPERVSGI